MTGDGTVLTAGAGRAEVELPPGLLPWEGFTSVRDPLCVRVAVLDDGVTRLAVVVIDQTSVFDDQIDRTRQVVHRVCAVQPPDCLVVASHTFSAPHVLPPDRVPEEGVRKNTLLADAVHDAVVRAATLAAHTMRAARIGFGRGRCAVNVQRDVPTPDGWWLGADTEGETDDSVGVLRVDDLDGRPVALLVNFAVQSSVLKDATTRTGGREVSADLAGAAVRRIEARYGDGTVALFLIGAAGDQAPRPVAAPAAPGPGGTEPRPRQPPRDACEALDLLAERLADTAVRVSDGIGTAPLAVPLRVVHDRVRVPAQKPPAGLDALRPSTRYAFEPDGTAEAPLVVVRIGDTVLAGVQAELNARTGLAVRRASPFPRTCVVTMVNGAAKYMADQGSYDRITYEAMNSRYGRGAAETVAGRIVGILRSLAAADGTADA
ncbi:hypothetical protein OHB00_48710 [Streptomyces sp. NBC_00631]|uniref:hypothetical protein n=1 Tax=Streptomyces sp. NBC_00631 TaxID=2975793 RepID=UPI0030DFBAB4